jgi:peptide/nickel transport system permease protein
MIGSGPAGVALGGGILILLLLVAVLAPWIAPQPPADQDLARRLEAPTPGHPLGRDELGRDVLSRLIWGTRLSLPLGLLVVAISAASGTLLGALAGYAGGRADAAITALAQLLLAFPGILLAIALVGVLGPRASNLVVALSVIGWVGYALVARGETLRLKRQPFLEAACSLGASGRRVVVRHLLPHLAGPIGVQAALGLGGVVMAEAGLSFLGLGVPPPAASWGGMLRDGTQNLLDAPRLAVIPGTAIFATVLAAQILGDGLRRLLLGGSEGGVEAPALLPAAGSAVLGRRS